MKKTNKNIFFNLKSKKKSIFHVLEMPIHWLHSPRLRQLIPDFIFDLVTGATINEVFPVSVRNMVYLQCSIFFNKSFS